MGHQEFFPIFLIIIIIPTFLVKSALSADRHFEACEPKHCGNSLIINYPFWIPHVQESYCGHPNLEITCTEDKPILKLSNNDYVVQDIFYKNQSLLVANAEALDETCPILLHNLTLIDVPIKFGPDHINLFFFYNCTSVPTDHFKYLITCTTNKNTSLKSFAMFIHDGELEYFNASSEKCEAIVAAPVDFYGEMTFDTLMRMDYTDMLKKGFLLEWTASNCSECEGSGGRCGSENQEFICFCQDRPYRRSCKNGSSNLGSRIGIGAVLIVGAFIIAVVIIFCCFGRKYSLLFWKRKTKNGQNIEAFLKNHGPLALERYTYSDIKKMTNSFKEKLGQGGFGGVFKGKLLDGRVVAVKVLSETKGNGEEFINEVASISRTSHVNIVTLFGFCVEGSKRALVYEFMPNGSLEKFIYDEKSVHAHQHLGWETIYKIAIGIAHGLEYLHRGCKTRILHFDIKPHNILLDEEFFPKISDFGLAKLCLVKESIISMIGARGTPGYIAPELFSRNFGGVSHKSDVYSYGMMVLEMVGRRKNIDARVSNTSEIYFPHWIYNHLNLCGDLGLHDITTVEEKEITWKMIVVGLWCIQIDPLNRPSMSRVLEMLGGSLEALQIPPKPFLSSPPREQEEDSSTR